MRVAFRVLGISLMALVSASAKAQTPDVKASLTFHAPFDGGPDATVARGDKALYWAGTMKRDDPKPGLPEGVVIARGAGKRGDALRFLKKSRHVIFFRARDNLAYKAHDWGGTVSFWLNVDPGRELDPDYVDPLQITPRAWNDAALWVDFSKDDAPRHFRLGAFADLRVWNPSDKDFEKMPAAERPMFDAGAPPFTSGRWSHVVITFERFNTGRDDGVAALYLDGTRRGAVAGRTQTFTWDVDKAAVMIGLNYTGLFDELSLFDRALSAEEVHALYEAGGVAGAHRR
jgi:hypothetical protein